MLRLGATGQEATRRFQESLLRSALSDANGNVTEAARRLDLSRAHVYNLLAAFGVRCVTRPLTICVHPD